MRCFVIMPFGNPRVDAENAKKLDAIYSQWIKPAVESITDPESGNKLTCHRADKSYKPGEIVSHIIENLVDSEIVIADLSGRNPNVFYELGVRHAVGNNCILIADNLDDIPFDLRPLRTIVYQYEPAAMLELKNSLELAIQEILREPTGVDNPVRRFLYNKELSEAVKRTSSDAAIIKNVVSEMESLRNEFNAQTNEIRKIMNLITSKPSPTLANTFDMNSIEGVWQDKITKSTFYVRVTDGELQVPYSYSSDMGITGHIYNCKIMGDTVFGRFEWLDFPISGYMYLRLEKKNLISGGWWYIQDLPRELTQDISKVNEEVPGMNRLQLQRISDSRDFPPQAEEYFRTKR